ncbi:MAG: hypothetical protein ACYDA8_10790 [Deferrisomatales bacterium]
MDAPGLPVTPVKFPEGLRLREVETSLDGLVSRDRALTRFVPQGYATPTWVYLEDDQGREFTLVVRPLLGRAEVHDGRIRP